MRYEEQKKAKEEQEYVGDYYIKYWKQARWRDNNK